MPKKSEDRALINLALISSECIDKVVSFIPKLQSIPAEKIASWGHGKGTDGVLQLSLEPSYHPVIRELMQSLNENHFVQPFDWLGWQPSAEKIFREPSRVSKASLETCAKLITLHVRKDRFCGGHFGEMVRSEHICAILHRLAALRKRCEQHPEDAMRVYFLTRSSLPPIQDGQMKIILMCLQPPGTKKTLDQLVRECLSRNYAMTFKKVHEGDDLLKFTADSILYHLDRMGSLIGTEETR